METALSESEEKALVGVLYNHVSFGTTLQVFGEVGDDNGRINTLREALERLLVKYDLIDMLSPENLVMRGTAHRVPRESLVAFAANDNNKHLQLRAQYFLKKFSS